MIHGKSETRRLAAEISPAAGPCSGGVLPCKHTHHKGLALSLLSSIVLLLLGSWTASAASITATVDRSTIPVGETLTLSLVFDGVNPNSQPSLPELPNFRVNPGSSHRKEFSFDGTRQTLKNIFDYQLVALRPGAVTIPGFAVQAGGATFTSQPIQITVVAASEAAAAQAAALTNLAFLRLIVPKTQVYIGEPFPVELHLYWQNADDIRMPQVRADGFATGQLPKPAQSRTQIGNTIYNLAVFRFMATAARTGNLTLGPAEESLTLLIPTGQRRSRSPFDPFFGMGNDFQQRPTVLTSETIPMQVLPLPQEGMPEDFNGSIGNYQMRVTASPTNIAVGDPITVRVQISGNGPLDALAYPAQGDWRDFNTYPATAKLETTDPLGLSGSKHFEQVIVPQNHELSSLPPFRFSFFDPAAKRYRTLTGPRIPLTIRPGAGTSVAPPVLTNANQNAGAPPVDDILHIRPRLEQAGAVSSPLLFHPGFLALQGVPLILWGALFGRRKWKESLAGNPRLRRQRQVAHRIREGLRELRKHAEAQNSDAFFALLFRLLQEQLGERLDMPAGAITEAVVDERLRAMGLSEASSKAIHELFQACNMARYAPVRNSQELAALLPKLETALRDLQALRT
jgi:hypothetical protein